MKIFRPVRDAQMTQRFGERKACITSGGAVIYKRSLTCPIGSQDFYESLGMKGHNGTDFATYVGEKLYFPVVAHTTWRSVDASDWSGGLGIDVISNAPISSLLIAPEGEYAHKVYLEGKLHVKFRFWHLNRVWADPDVFIGEEIGQCGNTGASSAPHLHMSMKFCTQDGTTLDDNNGYDGAVSFEPYYIDQFILEHLLRDMPVSPQDQINRFLSRIRNLLS